MAKNISDMGFNCVRLVYSTEMFLHNPIVSDDVVSANPDFKGLRAMEVFDKTVEALTNNNVMVILNNHISDAIWCCGDDDGNGLWYNKNFSTIDWLFTIVSMSFRYKFNRMVVGVDLRNEIRNDNKNNLYANWGNGDDNDWHQAATTGGNLILRMNPAQLIIVEGLNYDLDLSMIRDKPIKLEVPNKLVYSFHLYSFSGVVDFDNYGQFKN